MKQSTFYYLLRRGVIGGGGSAAGPTNTIAPVISGTAERGETLTSTTGTWTGTGTISYAYQWKRSGADISGATSSTYVLVAADDNAFITCNVTATDDTGSRSKLSNSLGPVLAAPLNLTNPVASGTAQVGETLSTTDGTWQGIAPITFAYQWRRDAVNISGATSSTYTLVAADYLTDVDCVVTATNSLGSANADSNDIANIAGTAPVISGVPTISGTAQVLETLTASLASVSGVPTPTSALQWQISNDGVSGWSDIVGETSTTYTIALADDDKYIRVVQTSTNAEGSDTANSASTSQVAGSVPVISGVPTISTQTQVGETITATAASVSGVPTPTTSWQWQRSADGSTGWANISGATSSTYTLVLADDTNYVRAVQTETNALGSDSANSAASAQISDVPAVDTDYQAVLDRASSLGYTAPSAAQQTLQNTLVEDLKTAGVWDKLDVFYCFATDGDSDYATLNWKAPSSHQVTKVSSPTFTADSGFSGDGSTAYLDTNFSIVNDATNYTQNNASTFTYFVSDLSQTDFVAYGARNDVDPNKVRNQLRMRSTDYRPAINDDRPIIAADYRSNNWHHQKRTASTGFTTFLDSTSFTNTISSKDISDLDFSMRLLTLHFKTTGGTSNLFGSAEGTMKVFGLGEALDNTDLKDAIDTYLTAL